MKNFLHLFRNGLFLLFLTSGLNAFGQEPVPCAINCSSSNDFYVSDLYLGDSNGNEITSLYECPVGGETLTIYAVFTGSTAADRKSLKLFFNIYRDGTYVNYLDSCLFDKTAITVNSAVPLKDIEYNCGDVLELRDFYMSWQTANNKSCDCNNKCFYPGVPLVVRTPLFGDFEYTSECVTGKSFETFTFTDASSSGLPPYTYSWTFGTGAIPATSASSTQVVEYSSGGSKTVTMIVTDSSSPAVSRTVTELINVTACCNLSITCPVESPYQRQTGINPWYTVAGTEFDPNVTSSNCTNYVLSNNKNQGSTLAGYQLAPGSHTIIWTAIADGQTAKTCTISVFVTDNQETSFSSCPSEIIVNTAANLCNAPVTLVDPEAEDNVGVETLTWVITGDTQATSSATGINYVPSPYTFNKGVSTVTYTAKDAADNSAVCSYTVTVNDNQAPSITLCAPDVTVNTDPGVCYTLKTNVTLGVPTASDNCGGMLTVTNNALAQFPKGDTNVTWTVTDASGNSSTCIQEVKVVDNEIPQITCQANIVAYTSISVPDGAIVNYTAPVGTDNCTGAITTQTAGLASGSKFPIGTTTNTFRVTDETGKTATCSFSVTVNDAQGPVIDCPIPALAYETDPELCVATLTFTATATDNDDDNPEIVYEVDNEAITFSYDFPVGTTTVTVIATDDSGNSSTCSFDVKVEDKEAPSITCTSSPQDPIILFELETEYIVDGVEFDPTTYSDNCSGVTLSYSINNGEITGEGSLAGEVLPIGEHTVVWTAEDASGNTASCSFDLTIFEGDCVDLSGVCGNTYIVELYPVKVRTRTVYRGYLNTQQIIDDMVINCGYNESDITITYSQTVFTPSNWGDQNWVTISVKDPSDQIYSCSFRVIVRYPLKSGDIFALSAGQPGYDNLDIEVQVFPNPTTGKLKVDIYNLNDPRVTAVVYNINGAVVMYKEISTTGHVDIDLTGKVSGLYLLRLVADNREFLHKIILENR